MRFLSLLVLGTSFLAGCAADSASPTASTDSNLSSPYEPAGIAAEVTAGSLKQTVGQCSVSVDTVAIKVPDAAITKKINDAFAFDVKKELDTALTDCTRAVTLQGHYEVVYDQWNLLTVKYWEYYDAEGAAHPSEDLRTWNFDLETGALIDLRQALDAEGLAMLVDACKSDPVAKDFPEACERSVIDQPVWEIESSGIRIHPVDVPHAAWNVAVEGAAVSWMPLNGHFKEKALQAIAP